MPSSSPRPEKHGRWRWIGVCLLLLVLSVAIWMSPTPAEPQHGPSALETQLNTERARNADLKRQLDDATGRSRRPRPPMADEVALAANDDLRAQLLGDQARLARPRPLPLDLTERGRANDLKARLDAANARPRVVDGSAVARAEDLARQNDWLNDLITRPRPVVEPPVTAPLTRDQILQSRDLFGVYTQQSPFSYAEVDLVQGLVGRRANIVGFFQDWQNDFRPDAIEDTWKRGQIPLLTWESQPQIGSITSDLPDYNLPAILSGRWDDYIRRYAQGIRGLGLPLILRFDHEMNGTWYPWSEVRGTDGSPINGNGRGQYVQMWRHVHDIFEQEGANQYVIWVWSPNRVNRIPSQPDPSEFYPGDDVVDWIGMSGYNRPRDDEPTFDDTFGPTLPLLRASSASKPIFLAELGATELGGHKPAWIHDLFRGVAANADIVGFAWFSLAVTSSPNGTRETNDWRLDSSPASIGAMKEELATSSFGMP